MLSISAMFRKKIYGKYFFAGETEQQDTNSFQEIDTPKAVSKRCGKVQWPVQYRVKICTFPICIFSTYTLYFVLST